MGFDICNGLFDVFSAIQGLLQVINENFEIIATRNFSKGAASSMMYPKVQIFVAQWSLLMVNLLDIRLLQKKMGMWNWSVEASIFRASFLWNSV